MKKSKYAESLIIATFIDYTTDERSWKSMAMCMPLMKYHHSFTLATPP
jgi:hypothetical protein